MKKDNYRMLVYEMSRNPEFSNLCQEDFDYFNGNDEVQVEHEDRVISVTDFGDSEGIYIDFYVLRYLQDRGYDKIRCATAKTLYQDEEWFIKMHERAARLTLAINKILWERQLVP